MCYLLNSIDVLFVCLFVCEKRVRDCACLVDDACLFGWLVGWWVGWFVLVCPFRLLVWLFVRVYLQIQHKCTKTTPTSSKSSCQKQCAIAANKQTNK
jgi:hypothetical protein